MAKIFDGPDDDDLEFDELLEELSLEGYDEEQENFDNDVTDDFDDGEYDEDDDDFDDDGDCDSDSDDW